MFTAFVCHMRRAASRDWQIQMDLSQQPSTGSTSHSRIGYSGLADTMVTWPMKSCDPKRSNSWPQYLRRCICITIQDRCMVSVDHICLTAWSSISLTKTWPHQMLLVMCCYNWPLLSGSLSVGVCVSVSAVCLSLVFLQNCVRKPHHLPAGLYSSHSRMTFHINVKTAIKSELAIVFCYF